MNIGIKHCNNIDTAKIALAQNKLNTLVLENPYYTNTSLGDFYVKHVKKIVEYRQ